jgi:Mitochondrial carrier protein
LYFVFYEYLKDYAVVIHNINNHSHNHINVKSQGSSTQLATSKSASSLSSLSSYAHIPFYSTVLCAATAGGLASFITSPLDMAKLRLQVQRGAGSNANMIAESRTNVYYTGLLDCLRKVYSVDGMKGLFRGAGARVLHFAPATTVTMTTYETCRRSFESFFHSQQGYYYW